MRGYNGIVLTNFLPLVYATPRKSQGCTRKFTISFAGAKNKKSGSGTGKGTLSLFVVLGQGLCYTGIAALLRSPCRGKEVNPMENLVTFFQTVAAEVVAYYLCKWLDSLMCKGSKH